MKISNFLKHSNNLGQIIGGKIRLSTDHQNARECSKKSVQPCPEQSRMEGRSPFDARSIRVVRERERREERHVCEPEGRQHGENAAGLSACGTHRQAAFFNIPSIRMIFAIGRKIRWEQLREE